MHIEFSYDDYIYFEILKHLFELLQITTDLTYNKIVEKLILKNISKDDIIKLDKNNQKIKIEFQNSPSFEYSTNKGNLVLQSILDTLKYIKSNIDNKIIDNPNKFFYNTFNKIVLEKSEKDSIKYTKSNNFKITNKQIKTIYCKKSNNNDNINKNLITSTIISKL